MQTGIVVSMLMLVAGQAVPSAIPVVGELSQLGALGVLAWVAWTQRSELRETRIANQDVINTLCSRWDAWEKIRHADSEKLDKTLLKMTAQCSEVQAKNK